MTITYEGKRNAKVPGKEEDMNAMNRFYNEYSVDYVQANLESLESGSHYVHASLDQYGRENCVLDIGYSCRL